MTAMQETGLGSVLSFYVLSYNVQFTHLVQSHDEKSWWNRAADIEIAKCLRSANSNATFAIRIHLTKELLT
jgi:hypothetical protein